MRRTYPNLSRVIPLIAIIALLTASCHTTKAPIYFNNIQDTLFRGTGYNVESIIRPNDLLNITVTDLNPEASNIFNAPIASQSSIAPGSNTASNVTAPGQSTGYLVNNDGFIQLPVLGNLKAAGLTKSQLKENITRGLVDRKLLMDPIVTIRFTNFRVTILGEVARPTVVNVPSEKISILEAIGLAGDLTIYAKRDNVVLIREEEGTKIIRRLNLNATDIFTSPYYYLKSNDIIYAEPNENKIAMTSETRQLLPIVLSALTLIVIFLDRLIFN
jgi:polysaccharide biosynthesis/export protein